MIFSVVAQSVRKIKDSLQLMNRRVKAAGKCVAVTAFEGALQFKSACRREIRDGECQGAAVGGVPWQAMQSVW